MIIRDLDNYLPMLVPRQVCDHIPAYQGRKSTLLIGGASDFIGGDI